MVEEGERSHNGEAWRPFEQAAGMMPGVSVRRDGMSMPGNKGKTGKFWIEFDSYVIKHSREPSDDPSSRP